MYNKKPFSLLSQKLVCGAIRRGALPYPELFVWRGCAKFVRDYVAYEQPREALVTVSTIEERKLKKKPQSDA